MSQSLARVALHLVFSTKNRSPFLRDMEVRQELHKYMVTTFDTLECPAMALNGVDDHVHVLFLLSRKLAIAQVVETVKSDSSKWIKKRFPRLNDFYWQGGYGVFSVSESMIPEVKRYIASQEEHHRKMSFQDEFRALCGRHNLEIDERYVWD